LSQNAEANSQIFINSELEKTKIEIVNDANKIVFYDSLCSHLCEEELDEKTCKTLCKDGEKVIDKLYDYYCHDFSASFDTWEGRDALVSDYLTYGQGLAM
jgi:hypothetical protein